MSRLVLVGWLGLAGCVGVDGPSDPGASFDQLWTDFDAYYGMFGVKGVDWDAAYAAQRPRLGADSTDAELYAVVVDLLTTLDDKHVTLFPAGNPELPRWSVDLIDGVFPMPPFDLEVIRTRYLSDVHDPHPSVTWGRLAGDVGYLHVGSFDGDVNTYTRILDDALTTLAGTRGLVVDVRDNPGGYDPLAQHVASRFADRERPYMSVRKRSGPAHDDFTDAVVWSIAPTDRVAYTAPVALLTTYATQSAGETFTLAMRELPQVTHLGDTTAGAFSDNILRETWNGWAYTISVGDYRAADGQSYEGVGLTPQVVRTNTDDDLAEGRDVVLDEAIRTLTDPAARQRRASRGP